MRFPKLFQSKPEPDQGELGADGKRATAVKARKRASATESARRHTEADQELVEADEHIEVRTKLAYAQHDPSDLPAWFTSPRPPRWFTRALMLTVLTVFVAIFLWRAMGSVTGVFVNLVIAFFLALVMEPMVLWLVKRGWKRGLATMTVLLSMIVGAIVLTAVFGQMFVEQTAQLIGSLPELYETSAQWIEGKIDVEIPAMNELQKQLIDEYGQTAAGQVLAIGAGLMSFLFNTSVVLLVAYYLTAAGPRFRASICAWVTPNRQEEFLRLWEITQRKVSDYINSRLILAAVSSVFTYIFLEIISIPYALPLAIFTGVVSQFVPTIGTYIGGALPIIFAVTSGNVTGAIMILVFIIVYQQVENLWLSPKISSMALSLNPAVAFIVVLSFGAVFGALGAFLSLPIAATVQAIASTYLQRHELIDSELLRDPRRRAVAPQDPEGPQEPAAAQDPS